VPETNQKDVIDNLLDIYLDYQFLYSFFGDEEYKKVMDLIHCHLVQYVEETL